MLAVTYVIEGDLDRLRVPAPAEPSAPRFGARLWEHTCCEIFIARKGLPAYHEFNLLPFRRVGGVRVRALSRRHAARRRVERARQLDPHVTVRGAAARLELDAVIRLDRLSPAHPARGCRSRCRRSLEEQRRLALVLGAQASARQAGFPSCRCVRPGARRDGLWCSAAIRMKFGIDRLLEDPALRKPLAGRRVGAARASGIGDARSRALARRARGARRHRTRRGLRSPARPARRQAGQHDRVAGLHRSGARHPGVQPVRQRFAAPPPQMLDGFDVLLVDLQDLGCRVYTFVTTLRYVLEAAAERGKSRLGARPAQPGGPPDRGDEAAGRLGKLRRRRAARRCATGSRWASLRSGSCARCASMWIARWWPWRAGSRPQRRDSAGPSASARG